MDAKRDAFGETVQAYYRDPHAGVQEIIERDDGYIEATGGPANYFAPFEAWPEIEQVSMTYVRGRVLDVGCGPGRVCLHLQAQGHEVTGIDNSPGAVEVARWRGVVDARLMSVTAASRKTLGYFDTIVLLGNNFGLLSSWKRARWLLRRFHHMTGPEGRIVAQTRSPGETDNPLHLAYHARNRRRGRLPGRVRLRNRFRATIGPWFEYLFVSPEEMSAILDGTGWEVGDRLSHGVGGLYVALIRKTGSG